MPSSQRKAILPAARQTKAAESSEVNFAQMPLYRYYMTHPVSTDGFNQLKANVRKLDATFPWRLSSTAQGRS